MKRFLLITLVAMVAVCANARLRFNVKAGYAPVSIGDASGVFKAGLGMEVPVSGNLLFVPSLEYKYMEYPNSYYYYKNDKDCFLQIPFLLAYRVNIGKNIYMTPKFGPYVASDFTSEIDAGALVGVDFEFKKMKVGVEFEKGFIKNFSRYTNSSLFVTLGYTF